MSKTSETKHDTYKKPKSRTYFPKSEANKPSRMICKALTIALMAEKLPEARAASEEFDLDWHAAAELICGKVLCSEGWSLTESVEELEEVELIEDLSEFAMFFLTNPISFHVREELFNWALKKAPKKEAAGWQFQQPGWWDWLSKKIDWEYVARRLRKEQTMYLDREEMRFYELMHDKPWERIEASGQIGPS